MRNQPLSAENSIPAKLPDSIRYIIQHLEDERTLKPAQVRRIILAAKVQPEDLMPWADFDHPLQDSYGRKLIYKGDNFEIMAMSWQPGDISTIHDHGYTQWGCVQVFGPAEHATFRMEDDQIYTLSRETMKPFQAIGVNHQLLHQMGNRTKDQQFLTLHVYGDLEDVPNVTGDARVLDLENETIQRVDGGVFFALPNSQIKKLEKGPKADFPTRLRHLVELIRRLNKMEAKGLNHSDKVLSEILDDFYSLNHKQALINFLSTITDGAGNVNNSIQWRILNWELREAAQLQAELEHLPNTASQQEAFTDLYDALSGRPMLEQISGPYLKAMQARYELDFSTMEILSIGCGTGLVEAFLQAELGAQREKLYGIDLSETMVDAAQKRIRAAVGDVLTLDPAVKMYELAFMGGRVLHFVGNDNLKEGIERTAAILKPGGYFIGDFITPDHIRRCCNVVYGYDQQAISLRDHQLVEEDGAMFMHTEMLNISFLEDQMRFFAEAPTRHFLPSLNRVRQYLEEVFRGKVEIFDAVSLDLLPESADSCPSTRYVVVAQKGA